MEREGVALLVISYDPVSVLAAFAEKYGITYPLLSDEGSHTIRSLGLLNRHVAEQQTYYGRPVAERHQGIPYPGSFVLDENGVVVEKQFEQSYRIRPTPPSVVEAVFGGKSGLPETRDQAATEQIEAAAWMVPNSYRPYQKLVLNLAIQIAPGLHLYGSPVPESFTPLSVEMDPVTAMEVGSLALPEPHPLRMEGLDETFHVYEGTVRGTLPIVLKKYLGDVKLVARIRYQACGDLLCYPPAELALELPLAGSELLESIKY